MWLRLICIHGNTQMAWELIQNNSFGLKAAVPKARNLKLAVISSFITVNWKHVRLDSAADGTPTDPFGEKLSLGLRGSRLCLFIQIAGKHSVFRKRRQLLLQFCPLFEQHSIIPHLSRRIGFLPPLNFFRHLASLQWRLHLHSSLSKSNPSARHDPLNIWASEMHFSCNLNGACAEWHLNPAAITQLST